MGFRSVITFIVLTFALHSCKDDDGGKRINICNQREMKGQYFYK